MDFHGFGFSRNDVINQKIHDISISPFRICPNVHPRACLFHVMKFLRLVALVFLKVVKSRDKREYPKMTIK